MTNWSTSSVSKSLHTNVTVFSNDYSEVGNVNSVWLRNSGIDSGTTYDDATLSYDEVDVYYDDYDATTITADDVSFSEYTDANSVNKGQWTE